MGREVDKSERFSSVDAQEFLEGIGRRLRAVRKERGLSLAQVAERAGLTRGFLSQLELGVSSASIGSLLKLSQALGVEFTSLFEETSAAAVIRRSDRIPSKFGGDGVTDYMLTPVEERRVQLIETHLQPGASAASELWTTHGELVVVTVTEGSFELSMGNETTMLSTGDTMVYDPRLPHTWRNPSKRSSTTVLFFDVPATL